MSKTYSSMVTLVRNENETDQKTQYFTRILQRICARVESGADGEKSIHHHFFKIKQQLGLLLPSPRAIVTREFRWFPCHLPGQTNSTITATWLKRTTATRNIFHPDGRGGQCVHWRIQGGAPGTRAPPGGPNSFIFMQFSVKM